MSYPISLAGKVVLILGGSGGIGAATARLFAGSGARVAITHRAGNDKAAIAEQLLIGLAGDGHAAFAADVADTATLLTLLTRLPRAMAGSIFWSTAPASPGRCRMPISMRSTTN